ncbi:MAG: HD domain-containing protein [Campylobacter sp.]|nr:HD domain-containing protein [Campylobacter sp.]
MAIPTKMLSLGANGEDYLVDYLNKNYLNKYKLKKVEKNPSNLLKNNHQQGDIFITCEDDAVIKVEVKSGISKNGTSYTVSATNKPIDQYLKEIETDIILFYHVDQNAYDSKNDKWDFGNATVLTMPTKDFLATVKPGAKILKESIYNKGTYYVSANDLDTKPSYEALRNLIEQHSPSYVLSKPEEEEKVETPTETGPILAGEELSNKFLEVFDQEIKGKDVYGKNRFYKTDLTKYADDLKKIVSTQEKRAMERFFTGAASSSGKYHKTGKESIDLLKEEFKDEKIGGLAYHSKRVYFYAAQLAEIRQLNGEDRDALLIGALLHDLWKYHECDAHTNSDHPLVGKDILMEYAETTQNPGFWQKVASLVETHAGQWNFDRISGKKWSLPVFDLQWYLHYADMFATNPPPEEIN